ncbi:tyrosinase [Pyrenophora seminiperda CCB06]|uniref:tyrosinase n=1 Tax=Pyrenophora seminiperda CCB06 TaxID=1302712 RepID=A0A3M7LXG1_9PLEO|nr:tyrosinase [Pyrenophora seminiperda CCB06]
MTHLLFLIFLPSYTTCALIQQDNRHEVRQTRTGLVIGATSRDLNGKRTPVVKAIFPDQWTLYILALNRLHNANQSDAYSFYGIASIHGRPYQTWGDAPGLPDKQGKTGYCPHGNELFMGWHRPYLALFEASYPFQLENQVVSNYAHDIAMQAPADQMERYLAAANEFRIPYWDWAQGITTGPIPDMFTTPVITITNTDGVSMSLSNPLYSYQFKPVPEGFDDKWRNINATIRWPNSDDTTAQSQNGIFADAFAGQSANIIAQLGIVFRSSSFSRFSNTLEDPHGWIHGIVGGGYTTHAPYKGHMWPLEYSAFDPIFMLHHANVDRLLALYQAAHPDSWMETSNIGSHGNVYLEDYQEINGDTDLLPFRKTPNEFWSPNACRNTTVLGYAYPETQRWMYTSDEAYQNAVTSVISSLYGGQARSQLMALGATALGEMLSGKNNTFTDWIIQTHALSSKLPSTFIVRFSLIGVFQSDPSTDIGSWMMLMPDDKHDAQTSQNRNISEKVLNGTTSITSHLIDAINAGKLSSLNPDDVVPYLRDYLTWNIFTNDGTRIPQPSRALTVLVTSTEAYMPDDPGASIKYSEHVTDYPEIMAGKSSGMNLPPLGMMSP